MLLCVIFAALIVSVLSTDVTFKNVTLLGNSEPVWIKSQNSLQSVVSRKNIIQNIFFKDGDIIPILYNDAIANFNQLEAIDLSNHGVKIIHIRALNKLPMLQDLNLDDNNLKEIKADVFNELKNLSRLSLSRNYIDTIAEGAFNNLHNLTFLFLGGNNLSTFYPKWFKEKPFLILVDLTNNSIETIPDASFEVYDKAIFLGENKINNLTREMWGSGRKIFQLSLHGNEIDGWDEDLFDGISIMSLDVTQNQIECLNGTFSKMFVGGCISLKENPWDCECISEITNWYRNGGNASVTLDWGDDMTVCNNVKDKDS